MKILFRDGIEQEIIINQGAEIARVERIFVIAAANKESLPPLIVIRDSDELDRYVQTKDILMITYDDDR